GYTADEIMHRSVLGLSPAGGLEEFKSLSQRIENGKTVETFETVRARKDGSRIDVSLTLSPIKDDAGRVTGISAILRDISGRKEAEKALRDSEAQFQAIIDNCPAMIFVRDT